METIIQKLQDIKEVVKTEENESGIIPLIMSKSNIEINNIFDSYNIISKKEIANLTDDIAWLLLGFGYDMATYSLRRLDQRFFNNGLKAIGIATRVLDLRECLRPLVLYWDVHKKTNLSFEYMISVKNEFSSILKSFIERKEEDKSLKCMDFEIIGKEDCIQYMPIVF